MGMFSFTYKKLPNLNIGSSIPAGSKNHSNSHNRYLSQDYLENTKHQQQNFQISKKMVDNYSKIVPILEYTSKEINYLRNLVENKTQDNITKNSNETIIDNKAIPEKEDMSLFFTTQEILLYASVISATDAVAALTFVSETTEPKLYSILFGEGVINDAVCIVLYSIIQEFTRSGERKYIYH
jgi:hypothetical protein